MEKKEDDMRIELIQDQIIRFVQLDFSVNIPISEKNDVLDAVIVGLNTLGEELTTLNLSKT